MLEQNLYDFSNILGVRNKKGWRMTLAFLIYLTEWIEQPFSKIKTARRKLHTEGKNDEFHFKHAFQVPVAHPCKNLQQAVGNKGLKLRKKIKDGVDVIDNVKIQVIPETTSVRIKPGTDSAIVNNNC